LLAAAAPIADKQAEYKETTAQLSLPLPPIATSFAKAAEAAGVPYIGQDDRAREECQGDDEPWECDGKVERLPLPRQLEQCFDGSFATASDTQELWKKCSLVAGMHPDEATEAILDLSLQHGKAFAVVPCCVFPEMNRHRHMPDGTQVRTWEQFLCYLQAKDEGIRRQDLPFPGRNVVLYHMGANATTSVCVHPHRRGDGLCEYPTA